MIILILVSIQIGLIFMLYHRSLVRNAYRLRRSVTSVHSTHDTTGVQVRRKGYGEHPFWFCNACIDECMRMGTAHESATVRGKPSLHQCQ